MTTVIDASVALKWFIEEDGSEQAAALVDGSELLIAPDLIMAEVCNAAWKAVRAGTMLPTQQDYAASRMPAILDELAPLSSLAERAAEMSRILDHPAYDCFYLALAEKRAVPLVPADRRLLASVKDTAWEALVIDLREQPTTRPNAPADRARRAARRPPG